MALVKLKVLEVPPEYSTEKIVEENNKSGRRKAPGALSRDNIIFFISGRRLFSIENSSKRFFGNQEVEISIGVRS